MSEANVDDEIYKCLNLDEPKSFFLFAGAGSGKTKSLINVLKKFRFENVERLKKNAQKVAIITYTNAACEEIKRRLEFDSAFTVSTIHSFAWELIKPYTEDIKIWLKISLEEDINDLEIKQSKSKNTNTKTYIDRANKIEIKSKRLGFLNNNISKFIYSPTGENTSRDSLSHAEVISIAAYFIQKRPLMQNILVSKFPILLIDESQDTMKELIDAFFSVQQKKSNCFVLGMFGDTMQRIYSNGKIDLGKDIPDTWAKPIKEINHRCPKRIINLINKIRAEADHQVQLSADNNTEGLVRLFVVNTANAVDKIRVETKVSLKMSQISNDEEWKNTQNGVKILTLEHHMAAKRGGFSSFFDPLYAVDKLKTGLLDGTLPGISLFADQILPLIKNLRLGNKFAVAKIARKYSSFLRKETLRNSSNSVNEIKKANEAINQLFTLWNDGNDPSLNDILKTIYNNGLFQIHDVLDPIAKRLSRDSILALDDSSDKDKIVEAWDEALKCTFSQFEEYVRYKSDESRFGTHQGVKGLEFPRVGPVEAKLH